MNTHIPTIETLLGKTTDELNAIFRKAVEAAFSAETSTQEQECDAARQTAVNCRVALKSLHKPEI